jgi:ribonuclease P protein component
MLAKELRLPARISTKTFKHFSGSFFNLSFGENKIGQARFGFVVKKAAVREATERNRLKRQFRRFFEENYQKIKPGFDLLFKIKKESNGKTTKEIHGKIFEALEKEKLTK